MAKSELGKGIMAMVDATESLVKAGRKIKKEIEKLSKPLEPPDQPAQS